MVQGTLSFLYTVKYNLSTTAHITLQNETVYNIVLQFAEMKAGIYSVQT